VSVMVERLPIVMQDEEEWETEWEGLRGELDRWGKVWPKELGFGDPMDSVRMTKEQMLEMLPEGYTPLPRETSADHSGFLQTLDRKLKTRVYLSIRPNDNNNNNNNNIGNGWMFPTAELRNASSSKGEETIVECAKRAVVDMCGDEMEVIYISNCPMGVVMQTNEELGIEEDSEDGYFGTKTWFMRVQYSSGDLDEKRLGGMVGDWAWLDKDEMAGRVKEEKGDVIGSFYHYML